MLRPSPISVGREEPFRIRPTPQNYTKTTYATQKLRLTVEIGIAQPQKQVLIKYHFWAENGEPEIYTQSKLQPQP